MNKISYLSILSLLLLFGFFACTPEEDDDDGVDVINCTNGVQDGDETGVDCGGQCSPCQVDLVTQNSITGIFKEKDFSIMADEDNYRGTNTSSFTSQCAISYFNTIRRYVGGALDTDAPGAVIVFNDIYLGDYECSEIIGYPEYFFTGKNPLEEPGNPGFGLKIDWTDSEGIFWFSHKVEQGEDQFFDIYTIEKVNPFNEASPLVLQGAFNLLVQNSDQEVETIEGDFNLFIER